MNVYAAGALAGMLATGPMTLAMLAIQRVLGSPREEPLAPQEVTARTVGAAGLPAAREASLETPAWLAPHFGAGAVAGALYAPFAEAKCCSPAVRGAAFGTAFWAANYLGLLPSLGLVRRPRWHSLPWNIAILGSHVVWGITLGLMVPRLSEQDRAAGAAHGTRSPVARS